MADTERKHIPFVARKRGDRYRASMQVRVLYDFDQAASVLALLLTDVNWEKFGKATIERALRQAAQTGLTGEEAERQVQDKKITTGLVDQYRDALVEYGVFPAEADTRPQDADQTQS